METTVLNSQWPSKHFKTLQHCFAQKHGWRRWSHELELLYKEAEKLKYLYEVNRLFLTWARNLLKLRAEMIFLDSYPEYPDPNDRLISILNEFGASHYLSGPAAQDYIDPEKFREARIDLEYVNYDQLIRSIFSTTGEINSTSVLQLILEGQHEFKNH